MVAKHTSRRQILTAIAGGLTAATGIGRGKSISSTTSITTQHMREDIPSHDRSQPTKRPAYAALPGLNFGTVLSNIPSVMNLPDEDDSSKQPVILMDVYDFNWIQAEAFRLNDPISNNLAMAFGHLYRRGVIQPIDYTEFYPKYIQQEELRRNQAVIENVAPTIHRKATIEATTAWKNYSRGSYLDSFRSRLGREEKKSREIRRIEETRIQKLENGLGTPVDSNKRILDKHVAALKVRRYADEAFPDLTIKGIIGKRESSVISAFVDDSTTDTRHIEQLQPGKHIHELAGVETTRTLFNAIGEIATERTGVQHDDWLILGPTLALPQYDDLFDISKIKMEVDNGPDNITEEVVEVVNHLTEQEEHTDVNYAGEWLAESDIMPFAPNPAQQKKITKTTDYAATLSQYSDALRDLDNISQTARLIGASIVSDPSPGNDIDEIYQNGEEMIDQYAPRAFDESKCTAHIRHTDEWKIDQKWYENYEQARVA